MTRFSFDKRRPQRKTKFSTADMEDCFSVQLATSVGASNKEHKEMCHRLYKTFRKTVLNQEKIMWKDLIHAVLILGIVFILGGCQTYHAFGDDCQKVFKSITE